MDLTKKEALYIYNLLVETSVKLEKTDGSKVLGITLDNKKELRQVSKIMDKIYEQQTSYIQNAVWKGSGGK